MPDSRRAAGIRTVEAHNWEEYAGLLGPDRAQDVAYAGEELLAILEAYKGAWADFDKSRSMKRWEAAHYGGADTTAAAYYLQEKQTEKFAPFLKSWAQENGLSGKVTGTIYELFIRNVLPDQAPEERVLMRSVDQLLDQIRPSPDGKTLAFASLQTFPEEFRLQVIPAAGGQPILVDSDAMQADWTPDGQQLVYAKASGNLKGGAKDPTLGSISRRRIRDQAGTILTELGTTEDLAGIVFVPFSSRVACLPDGRILFAALAMRLPALDKDMPKTASLFTLQPDRGPTIKRVVSEKAEKQLPARVDCFLLSPDSTKAAIPGEKGELAIVSLASGEITKIQGPLPDYDDPKKLANDSVKPMLPSWRSNKEFSYLVGRGAAGGSISRAEIALRKIGGEPRVISKAWPNAMTDSFLPRLKD
jgi:hypothetical protein